MQIKRMEETIYMEMIASINSAINGIVWGIPMMILIMGTGIYLSVRCGSVSYTHLTLPTMAVV